MIKVAEIQGHEVVFNPKTGEFGLASEAAEKLNFRRTGVVYASFIAKVEEAATAHKLKALPAKPYLVTFISNPQLPLAVDATMMAQEKLVYEHEGARYWRWPAEAGDDLDAEAWPFTAVSEEAEDGSFVMEEQHWQLDTPEARAKLTASITAIREAWLAHVPAPLRRGWEEMQAEQARRRAEEPT
jgi:hypothetical protein